MDQPQQFRRLIAAARAARRRAYAPYSKFTVGAALLATDGTVHTGANVENASYGLSLCAERVALGQAVSAGRRRFLAIAVAAAQAGLSPCGACRQVLAEFGNLTVLCVDTRRPRTPRIYRLADLLPHAFKLDAKSPPQRSSPSCHATVTRLSPAGHKLLP